MSSDRIVRTRSNWITRRVVADMLGVDISKVRRMQRSNELLSVVDERGVHRFRRETIFAMAVARGRVVHGILVPPGVAPKIVAQAFEMFARGKTWQDVVIALMQRIDVARSLLAAYQEEQLFLAQKARAAENDDLETDDTAPEDNDPFAALQREQAEQRSRSQEAFEREQQAWEASQRRRREELERRRVELLTRLSPGADAPPADDGSSADLALLLALLMEPRE